MYMCDKKKKKIYNEKKEENIYFIISRVYIACVRLRTRFLDEFR